MKHNSMGRTEFQMQAMLNLMNSGRGDSGYDARHIQTMLSTGTSLDRNVKNIADKVGELYDYLQKGGE